MSNLLNFVEQKHLILKFFKKKQSSISNVKRRFVIYTKSNLFENCKQRDKNYSNVELKMILKFTESICKRQDR